MRYKMFGNLEIELREKFNFLKWIFPVSKKPRGLNFNKEENLMFIKTPRRSNKKPSSSK